jgi:predicted RNA-binding Zn-ribbon protein involved in translation (DUF1610 family)
MLNDNCLSHDWICDECGYWAPFRKPELPWRDPRSEAQESVLCPKCGAQMYWDESPDVRPLTTPYKEFE